MAARWRKDKRETGLASVFRAGIPRSSGLYTNRVSSVPSLTVAPLLRNREVIGWYWYGLGKNTANAPVQTESEAKEQARAYYESTIKCGGD